MISDEMRELLSTYVDGELSGSDTARVENMSKRDPELRNEIEAYRILRRRLKAWDEAENDVTPAPTLRERAVARARRYAAATGVGSARGWGGGVWALAAGLLLAACLGWLLAGGEQATVQLRADDVLPTPDRAPYETVRASKGVVSLKPFRQPLPAFEPAYPQLEQGLEGWLINGKLWTPSAIDKLGKWTAERDLLARVKRDYPTETRTGAWRPEIMALVSGYEAASVPLEGLVVFRSAAGLNAPGVFAIPAGADAAEDKYEKDRLLIDTSKLARGRSRLVLAGEVFLGAKDPGNRARVVSASSWVRDSSTVPMVWGDNVALPRNPSRLVLQAEMLGPKARRALARGETLPKGVVDALRAGAKARANAVATLTESLRADTNATGFAVVAGAKVIGVELFANHELMLVYAPRLLHGYLAEAGTKEIRLTEPTRGVERIQELARKLVDNVGQNAVRLQDVPGGTTDEWPAAEDQHKQRRVLVRRVNIMVGRNAVAGHGLLYDTRPLHLSLFAD